jgi:hypothetical protein
MVTRLFQQPLMVILLRDWVTVIGQVLKQSRLHRIAQTVIMFGTLTRKDLVLPQCGWEASKVALKSL